MDEKQFDKRVIWRNVNKGMVSQKDYDNHLSKLENMEDECEPVEVSLYPSEEEKESDAEPDEKQKPE
jgi:hypothetical protein